MYTQYIVHERQCSTHTHKHDDGRTRVHVRACVSYVCVCVSVFVERTKNPIPAKCFKQQVSDSVSPFAFPSNATTTRRTRRAVIITALCVRACTHVRVCWSVGLGVCFLIRSRCVRDVYPIPNGLFITFQLFHPRAYLIRGVIGHVRQRRVYSITHAR